MVAKELHEWIERTAEAVAADILESPLAPEVVQLSRAEMRAFYRTNTRIQQLLWLPDGSPNTQGRRQLMQELGPDGYEAAALAQIPDEEEVA